MANKNQQTAPEVQEQVNKAEAFFEKYKQYIPMTQLQDSFAS